MEKICLKWDYFEENIATSFKKLRTADDFYDVTLVTDDQHQVSAHKIVLASSSEYFKNILNNNKHVHPLLCLTGVWLSDLNNILDYIYNGEVKIQQDHLDGFLQIARRFRVEGLVRGEDSDTFMKEDDVKNHDSSWDEVKNNPKEIISGEGEENVENYFSSLKDTTNLTYKPKDPPEECKDDQKSALVKHFLSMVKVKEENHEKMIKSTEFETTENFDKAIEQNALTKQQDENYFRHHQTTEHLDRCIDETLTKREDGYYCCQQCGRASTKKLYDARRHVESHFKGLYSFPCQYCEKPLRTRNALRCHVQRNCPKRPNSYL